MTMVMDIKEQYMKKFEEFINSLPNDAVTIKNSLDVEIQQRVDDYKSGNSETIPFNQNLSEYSSKSPLFPVL